MVADAEEEKFVNLVAQVNVSLEHFKNTGERLQFVALQDQLDRFADECFDEEIRDGYMGV